MKQLTSIIVTLLAAVPALAQTLPPAAGTPVKLEGGKAVVAAKVAADKAEPASSKRVQKVAEQPLPGLGTMPGDKQALKSTVIRVSTDRNEIVYVSGQLANRIATPFDAPRVVDTSQAEIQTVGQSLYVIPKDPDKPVALYVTGSNPNDPVVSLTLVPKNLPPQTIVLQLDAPLAATRASSESESAPDNNVYTDRIRFLMRQVALGKAPEGFVEGALPRSAARIGGLAVMPQTRYSGPAYDIYKYTVQNASNEEVEMTEDAFYSEGVRSVAFFPTAVLRRGESTMVFVIADKSATGN